MADWRHPPPQEVLDAWDDPKLDAQGVPAEKPPKDVMQIWTVWCADELGSEICGAWSRQSHAPCTQTIINENGRCHKHGGMTPIGRASPNYEGKGHSKYIPKNLRESYERAANDPELFTLREEASVLMMRFKSIVSKLDRVSTEDLWREMSETMDEAFDAFRRSQEADDPDERREHFREGFRLFNEARDIVQQGEDEERKWSQIREVANERRRLVESETRRMHQQERTYTAEQMYLQMDAIMTITLEVLREYDVPKQAAKTLSRRVRRLTS